MQALVFMSVKKGNIYVNTRLIIKIINTFFSEGNS